ncbi:MAG: SGNH/GDSL hydrolase family protein [Planctomycetes bacterium]|nr:SGNH/GDSL hydrolase family protein [Planctomycetota bacterium]
MPVRRRWFFRCGAVLVGLSLFIVIEIACRLLGIGNPREVDDPFVGFSETQPLFELDESGDHYEIPSAHRKFFNQDSFLAKKPPGTFRIFCLGGSTVQGRPFQKETSFTTFLELGLGATDSSHDWEVINCGGISYASYRLVPILEECLDYEPDLIILCTGHNEFLEERSYGHLRNVAPLAAAPMKAAFQLHSFHAARNLFLSDAVDSQLAKERSELGPTVQARLDFRNGLDAYVRDDEWRAGVVRHFEFNINRLLRTARRGTVPVLVVLPPSNLADTPPFKSLPREGITEHELAEHAALLEKARRLQKTDPHGAVAALQASLKIDDRQAAVHYQMARLQESLGQTSRARESFVLARDHDICPLRILSPMEESLKAAADSWRVPLLDAHTLLEKKTDDSILGNVWLVDHVHPSVHGHQQIALALIQKLTDEQLATVDDDWQSQAALAMRLHVDAIPDVYFLKGEQRLQNLRYWTRGLAERHETSRLEE